MAVVICYRTAPLSHRAEQDEEHGWGRKKSLHLCNGISESPDWVLTGQHSKSLYKDCIQKAQPKEAQFPAADKERLKQVAPRPGVRKLWASPLL